MKEVVVCFPGGQESVSVPLSVWLQTPAAAITARCSRAPTWMASRLMTSWSRVCWLRWSISFSQTSRASVPLSRSFSALRLWQRTSACVSLSCVDSRSCSQTNKLHKFIKLQPLSRSLLTFRQLLLPSSERPSTRCCCDRQQVVIDMWKLVGRLVWVHRVVLLFHDVYRFPDPLVLLSLSIT